MELFDSVIDQLSWWMWLIAFIIFSGILIFKKPHQADPRDSDMRTD